MGIDFFRWILGKDDKQKKVDATEISATTYQIASEIYIRELAFAMIVNKIANAISKCEINIYRNNKKVKDEEWYRWNVKPNKNQNAYEFWNKLINQLYEHNEALIVVNNNELYVADDFYKVDDSAFFEHYFENVRVNNFAYSKKLYMKDVFYFNLNSKKLKRYLNNTLTLYGGLINAAYSSYLVANGSKGILKIDQYAEQEDDFEETFKQMVNEDFKKFFSSANAVMPLFDGYSYEQLDNKGTQSTTRDLKALLDDVIQFTANTLNVPASIASGNVQDTSKAIDEMLTFCIDPLIELLTDEMTSKIFEKYQVINGSYVKFDTKAIKHIDLLDVATSIDKLISSGFTCINDLRQVCGMDIIDEPWAWQFFMTKNYSTIEELIKELKGGGANEE